MPALLSRYATPLITGLFLVSLVSGVALFLGVGQGTFREMHEILSLVLILPFVLHVWRNWRPMVGYVRHWPMALGLAASVAVAVPFALPSAGGAGGRAAPPQFAVAQALLDDTPVAVAPVLGLDARGLVARLSEAGFAGAGAGATLHDIATASGRSDNEVLAALLPPAG